LDNASAQVIVHFMYIRGDFFHGKSYVHITYLFSTKTALATFWAIFTQTHLVTLPTVEEDQSRSGSVKIQFLSFLKKVPKDTRVNRAFISFSVVNLS
jgi:hypothetical protein